MRACTRGECLPLVLHRFVAADVNVLARKQRHDFAKHVFEECERASSTLKRFG